MGSLFGGGSASQDTQSAANAQAAQQIGIQGANAMMGNANSMQNQMQADFSGARSAAAQYGLNAQSQYNNYNTYMQNAGTNAASINNLASQYDSANKQEQLAQTAGEQVANQGAINNQNLERNLAARGGMGMSAGNLASMENDNNTQMAAQRAAAVNNTRVAAQQLGLQYDQAAMGANTGMTAMAGTGMGLAGNVANAGAAQFNTDVSGLAGLNSGYAAAANTANGVSQAATNQYNAYQNYQQNQLGYQNAASSNLGAIAGLAASYFTGGGYAALAAALAQQQAKPTS